MNVAKTESLIQGAEVVGALAAVAAIGYFLYKGFGKLADKNSAANKQDTQGDYSGGLAETIANNVATIGKSSETYTDASTEVLLHPIDSLKSILDF